MGEACSVLCAGRLLAARLPYAILLDGVRRECGSWLVSSVPETRFASLGTERQWLGDACMRNCRRFKPSERAPSNNTALLAVYECQNRNSVGAGGGKIAGDARRCIGPHLGRSQPSDASMGRV